MLLKFLKYNQLKTDVLICDVKVKSWT